MISNRLHISHLLFANDILLFSTANATHLKNLHFVINTFELALGLKVNMQKFVIANVNVEDSLLQQAKSI